MPVHVLSTFFLDLYEDFEISPRSWLCIIFGSIILAIRLWASNRAAAPVPPKEARDLHGKLIVMTGAFTSLGYAVFNKLAKRGARIVALTPGPVSSKEHQLLHLASVAADNDQLFVETCNVTSINGVRQFAQEWETKAATRRGALGEEIGRSHLDTLLLVSDHKEVETLELTRAMTPSIVKANRVPGAPTEASVTRVIYVLPSSFYAAADNERFRVDGETWADAQASLYTASRFLEFGRRRAAEAKPGEGELAVISISPGTTRSFLTSVLRPLKAEKPYLKLIPWSLIAVLYPWIWAGGKSSTEAARTIEWAVLAPLYKAGDKVDVTKSKTPPISAGVLYRNQVDAGSFLRYVTEEPLIKQIYEEHDKRIEQKLAVEGKDKDV